MVCHVYKQNHSTYRHRVNVFINFMHHWHCHLLQFPAPSSPQRPRVPPQTIAQAFFYIRLKYFQVPWHGRKHSRVAREHAVVEPDNIPTVYQTFVQ